jgi:hypothetical protein
MSPILFLAKLQWSITVDRLTYEKLWSIDRVSNLLVGVINIIFVIMSLLHHSYWLIPLGILNACVLISSMTGKNLLHSILTNCGFKDREEILQHLKIQVKAREQIKKMNDIKVNALTANSANVFIFDSVESQTINHYSEKLIVFLYDNMET